MKQLHTWNPAKFQLNPDEQISYSAGRYLYKILQILGITNYLFLDILPKDEISHTLCFGQYNTYINGKYTTFESDKVDMEMSKAPELLLIMTKRQSDMKFYPTQYYISDEFKILPEIKFKNATYVADSVILTNFNKQTCLSGHEISGVTCHNKRYLYNGWMKTTIDPAMKQKKHDIRPEPCHLMPFDWITGPNLSFCLDVFKCDVNSQDNSDKKVCFNISKGARTYIYIRKQPKNNVQKTKECLSGKVLNPQTNRCVNENGKIGAKTKECPPDKVLNPKTNRCVSKTGKVGKALLNNKLP